MPSIPQSLLWISLVVLWLFVLVPMLVSKRDAVRRTSDIALAARVLNSAVGARLLKRAGPAAGHRSDPDWRCDPDWGSEDDEDSEDRPGTGSAVVVAAVDATDDQTQPNYLDVDVVDEEAADMPVAGGDVGEPESDQIDDIDDEEMAEAESGAAEYEYVDDTSGLEAEEDSPTAGPMAVPAASRRRRYDSTTAAAVIARKYSFRKRVLMTMALILVVSAAAAFTVAPAAWWVCGTAAGVTMLYLAYLRRQTRIEERVRARRMQRMARAGARVDDGRDHGFGRGFDSGFDVPARLRRPGAVVLEIDDEDPVFEHLEYVPFARDHAWRADLPRAAGQ